MSYAKSDKNEAREMATTMRAVNKLLAVNTQCLPPDYLEVSIGEFVHTVADRAKRADALRPRSKKRKEDSKVSSSKNPVVTTAAELASNLAKQMRGLKGKMDAEKAERFTEVLRDRADGSRQGGGGVRGGVRQAEEAAQDEALRRVPGVLQDGAQELRPRYDQAHGPDEDPRRALVRDVGQAKGAV